ncbi:MAG: hypothetical protein P8N97_08390 [Alphaproteobacteria bacterium]|nr:hypothetical protein [Alphaproteobacteria bacterium]
MPIIIAIAFIASITSEPYQEFSENSNGMAEYKFVSKTSCQTGEHDTGYALAPFGTVVLKQVNTDGTITQPVCMN